MSIPFCGIVCSDVHCADRHSQYLACLIHIEIDDIQTAHRLIQSLGPLTSLFTHKRIHIVALRPNRDLNRVNERFRAGKLQCVLDRCFELDDVPEAIQLLGAGRHKEKVVISVATLEGS
jgi:NADPH:quinone reductase-like Zn-dependent oxidoreductase